MFLFLVTTTSNSILLVTLFSISSGFGGICWSGFLVNHLDLAPQYAGHLIALSHTLATIPAIFGPSLIKAIVKHGTIDEWNVIMYGGIIAYLFGASIFWKFADANIQPWATQINSKA